MPVILRRDLKKAVGNLSKKTIYFNVPIKLQPGETRISQEIPYFRIDHNNKKHIQRNYDNTES